MQTNMTERDKKLLVGMLIGVIIVAIGYWGILPQIKAYVKLNEKIEKEVKEKKLNETKLMNLGAIQIQADEYEKKVAERKGEFYQMLSSSEIDRMMTQLAVGNNLDIYDLDFTMPTAPTERLAYKNSQLYQDQLLAIANFEEGASMTTDESASDGIGETASLNADSSKSGDSKETEASINADVFGAEEGGYQPNTDIYAVPVSMTVGGDLADLQNFINEIIESDKRVLLVSYNWGEFRDVIRRDADGNVIKETSADTTASSDGTEGVTADEITDETVEIVTKKSLTIHLEIYMCDTSEVASDTDAAEE